MTGKGIDKIIVKAIGDDTIMTSKRRNI